MFGADQGIQGLPLAGLPASRYAPEVLAQNVPVGGRLSGSSSSAVTTTDQTALASLTLFPNHGGAAATMTGLGWRLLPIRPTADPKSSIDMTGLTANNNYDVWDFDDGSGWLACDVGPVWTDNATRAVGHTVVDGQYLNSDGFKTNSGKTVAPYRGRYRATVRASASGQVEDSLNKRWVVNYNNAVERKLFYCPGYVDDNASTTYLTSGTSTNWVTAATLAGSGTAPTWVAIANRLARFMVSCFGTGSAGSNIAVGISFDSATDCFAAGFAAQTSQTGGHSIPYAYYPADGFHTAYLQIRADSTASRATVFADLARLGAGQDPYGTYLEGYILG